MKGLVYGLIAGALGALAWGLAAAATGMEIGWIAWGVGGLVGFAVALGNEGGGRSAAAGGLAVVLTALSIFAGKYVAIWMLMPGEAETVEALVENFDNQGFVLSFMADEVAAERTAAGLEVPWPPGVDPRTASAESDYPADVWAEARQRWIALGPEGRTAFRDEKLREIAEANVGAFRTAMSLEIFVELLGPMDFLFFGLAMFTAFKVGSGMRGGEGGGDPLAEPVPEAVAKSVPEPNAESFGFAPVEKKPIRRAIRESELDREPGAFGYCPGCGTQYRAGIQACADCDVDVLPFSGPPA